MSLAINLLPYRQEKRLQLRRGLILRCLMAVGLALLVCALWALIYWALTQNLNSRVKFLEEKTNVLTTKIREMAQINKRIEILKGRENAINTFQASRNVPTEIMEELARITPEGVMLTRVNMQDNQQTEVTGIATNNELVSNYMKRIENTGWMRSPVLLETKTGDRSVGFSDMHKDLYSFGVKFQPLSQGMVGLVAPQLTPEGDALKGTSTLERLKNSTVSALGGEQVVRQPTHIEAPDLNVQNIKTDLKTPSELVNDAAKTNASSTSKNVATTESGAKKGPNKSTADSKKDQSQFEIPIEGGPKSTSSGAAGTIQGAIK